MADYFFFLRDPLTFHFLIILCSIYIIFKAADLIIDGISDYAHKLGLSDYIIGLVVVAMAASLPEIIASLTGLSIKEVGIMFGTIIGTNMIHIALVSSTILVIGGSMDIECRILEKSKILIWILLMLPFFLMLDGTLSRLDGVVLVLCFFAYLGFLWHSEGTLGEIKKSVAFKDIWRDALIFVGCLVALLLASRWLVFSTVTISDSFSISPYFLAITLIGIVSCLPDFVVGLKGVFKGHSALALGDILGSTVLELVFYFGIVAIFSPITVAVGDVYIAMIFLMLAISTLLVFMRKKVLSRWHGAILLLIYLAFIIAEAIRIFA